MKKDTKKKKPIELRDLESKKQCPKGAKHRRPEQIDARYGPWHQREADLGRRFV